MRATCLVLALLAGPALAQQGAPTVLDPAAVLALGLEPWRDRAGFVTRLEEVLGPVIVDRSPLPDRLDETDPFLWSLTGRFGAPLAGSSVAGGIVTCSRYGIPTRDRLAATTLSDPEVFTLFAALQPAADDVAAWPEAGLARLACLLTWDDTRRVAIIPEAAARAAAAAQFATVTRTGAAEHDGAQPGFAPVYDDSGYRIEGQDGAGTSVVVYDHARIDLLVSHQTIRFRAYLLNGGV